MTMTEDRPTRSKSNGHDEQPSLADQIVLSGAGLASQGIGSGRQILVGLLDAIDVLVIGVVNAGREAWDIGMGGIKTAVGDL